MTSNVYCTNCSRNFLAHLEEELDGNHVIECPFCHHVHYRVLHGGVVTEERYNSSSGMMSYQARASKTVTPNIQGKNIYLTNAWMNRSDLNS